MEFIIEYTTEAEKHLRGLTARQRSIVLDEVDLQLKHQPGVVTRNRKRMRPNPIAPWELRLGNLRIFYDLIDAPMPLVQIVAVGIKRGNKVYIQDEEV